ncbi:phosphoadenylyl-sulfate reductase [Marinigracilibium pacificum]|uniref:Adenosine 5'-phosphosulfate reductase n=1 Tax=Marinigracilibium pacificum TaxID=2729599 RepID=A0A848J103_9BACT|nr:phosphoadenylyl-sulfate reductase [Marinigracilibium pacificum]NMM50473.1 phosphoadenylyl-sulfate reductase [Marinigracilibium pacificum]
MTFEEFSSKIDLYKHQNKKIFTSSSFQTHSLVMLHMISRIDNTIPVFFINTGYHFPETLSFRDQIANEFGLNVIDIKSTTPKIMQKDANGRLLFTSDPDHCCYLNKVQPMEPLLLEYDVWINGVRGDQSAVRKAMTVEQPAPSGAIRFHPMLDWSMRDIFAYIKEHDLPRHPLDAKGYSSIGCEPCTRKPDPEMHERESRWFGMKKVECGLHTELVKK